MPTALGKRLFLARSKRGYTMEQLGQRSTVHASTINGIEKGRNDPGTVTTSKLAKALDVDPCWLAYGTGEKPDWASKTDKEITED